MPHRSQNHEAMPGQRHALPSLIEDDGEEEEDMLEDLTGGSRTSSNYPSYRARQASFPSVPGSSRPRPGIRPVRHTSHSSPVSAASARNSRARVPSVYSQFNQRYRQQSSADTEDAYFSKGQNSDSDEEDAHSRRTSANSTDPIVSGTGLDTLILGADEGSEAMTPEDIQRMEWQTMLASVLSGEVLRSEKTRIGRALESYEEQRINRLDLWHELRAYKRGRTIEQEKDHLDERRRRVVPTLIEEILAFRFSSEDDTTPNATDTGSTPLENLTALKMVASLLRRWDAAETLYPHLKGLRQDNPECGSDDFTRRLDTLTSWYAVATSIRDSVARLKKLSGSDTLDVTGSDPLYPAAKPSQFNGESSAEPGTLVERILKEDGLQKVFERGALVYLHSHVESARDLYLEFTDTLLELNLPTFTEDLLKIIKYPTQLMEEVLRVRLSIAKQVLEPSMLSVGQMLDDFRLAIGLACTLKSDYEGLMRPDPEGKWNIPPCIADSYEATILAALRFFFKLIHTKLKSAHQGIYFKETELLEAQWNIMEEVTMATVGGGLLVAEHISSLTHKLILRVITSFKGQIDTPAYSMHDTWASRAHGNSRPALPMSEKDKNNRKAEVSNEDVIRWYAKVLDVVRLRHRKLQRYSRLLMSRFGNSSEYCLKDADTVAFMDGLIETGHFLVYTELYEAQGLYIIGEPTLYQNPEAVRQLLSKAFQVHRRFPTGDIDVEAYEGSDVEEEELESEVGEGQYLLVVSPQDNFVWRGTVLVLSMPTVELEMEDQRVRLIATHPSRLRSAKDTFAAYFDEEEEEEDNDERESRTPPPPPLTCLVEQQAHLAPVNHELKKIQRSTHRLAETIVDSVHPVKQALSVARGGQELMENWFIFASEHGQTALRTMDPNSRIRLGRLLTRLAIAWVAFICDDCDPMDRKTFRWAVNALEFAMVRTRGNNILQLPEAEFMTLRQKVAACMTLLISHFDLLGARSSIEALKEKERERLAGAHADESIRASYKDEMAGDLDLHELSLTAPLDRSLRPANDRVLRAVEIVEETREQILVEMHLAGRVMAQEGPEDESLALLAATASKTVIRWQQGRFIAAGAFGSVYLALNLDSGGVMAAKEIRFKNSSSLTTLVQQVKDELSVMELLHHPNIVEYYGLELHRDKVYIFEEFCSGGTLTSLLETGRIEDEVVVKVYTMQMLEGIIYLHSMGVVHRDIKPDNILLDHNGIIKFVDFGASKILGQSKGSVAFGRSIFTPPPATSPAVPGMPMNSLSGTPMYMSPEVIKSDRRSRKGAMDIWSMGCVVLEMVTGHKPWSNLDNEWAIMFHIGVATQHPPLPEPGQLSYIGIDFIRQCLTIDGMKRPSAAELYDHPWIMEFRDELAAYEQESSDIPQTPSLQNSSLRSEPRSEAHREAVQAGVIVQVENPSRMYDTGMISPPGIFSDNETNLPPSDDLK
ncbi:Suppressor of Sensor Kinase (SLN1) [Tulasnella sp. 330]|nr:Suppressor of Sensor Kinase (SLN1) [Tulasnella sp. 330]